MKARQYKLMFELENTHWWFLAKRQFITSMLPRNNPAWNILDLGCGTGGLSGYLRNWGNVTRIDKSSLAIRFLKRNHLPFLRQDINTVAAPKNSFDLICLFDVLYHRDIKDDTAVLKNAYAMLKKGGILLVTDSALPWLSSLHDETYMARERYTLSELNGKVHAAGFTVVKKSYIYFLVFPIFFVTRIIGKYVPFETVGTINRFVNMLLTETCRTEAKLLEYVSFPIGSSVIIKAVK